MRRQHRNHAWVIAEQEDGTHEVWHGRRQVATGLQAITSAVSLVEKQRRVNERAWVADTEGYRTEITRRLKQPETDEAPKAPRGPQPGDPTPARTRYLANYGGGRKTWSRSAPKS